MKLQSQTPYLRRGSKKQPYGGVNAYPADRKTGVMGPISESTIGLNHQ